MWVEKMSLPSLPSPSLLSGSLPSHPLLCSPLSSPPFPLPSLLAAYLPTFLPFFIIFQISCPWFKKGLSDWAFAVMLQALGEAGLCPRVPALNCQLFTSVLSWSSVSSSLTLDIVIPLSSLERPCWVEPEWYMSSLVPCPVGRVPGGWLADIGTFLGPMEGYLWFWWGALRAEPLSRDLQ